MLFLVAAAVVQEVYLLHLQHLRQELPTRLLWGLVVHLLQTAQILFLRELQLQLEEVKAVQDYQLQVLLEDQVVVAHNRRVRVAQELMGKDLLVVVRVQTAAAVVVAQVL
jgi:hypothetical protein